MSVPELPAPAGVLPRSIDGWSDRRTTVVIIAVVTVVGIASFAWIYGGHLTYFDAGPIRSDATAYYLYLPALLIDHDVTLGATAQRDFGGNIQSRGATDVRSVGPHGYLLDEVGVGESLMLLPFFGVGEALAAASGAPTNGFSWPYAATAAAGAFCYALLGLALTASILLRWFRRSTVVVCLLAITFGSDLFHYATYDALFSHVFSLFLIAASLRVALSLWERPRLAATLLFAALIGFVALVRAPDLVVIALCALVGVERPADLAHRVVAIARRFDLLALGAGVFIAVCLPQLAYWHAITGELLVNPYPTGQSLTLLHPHLLGVLFSVRKGLFFWSPLLLLAVAGLPFLRRAAPPLFVPAVVFLLLDAWVTSSWSVRWYGGSFGMRPFVEAMPVFALGLAALIEAVRRPAAQRVLGALIALTTLLSVHAMVAYWQMTIPYDGTTLSTYLESFHHL